MFKKKTYHSYKTEIVFFMIESPPPQYYVVRFYFYFCRSQCTKEVEPTEIGRIFAIVALGQAIVPLISNPLFGGIYKATLSSYPGITFTQFLDNFLGSFPLFRQNTE